MVDPGQMVICDWTCNGDWSDREESGGLLFGSKAVCPDCAADLEKRLRPEERRHIRGRCPVGISFADWVRDHLR